MKKSTLLGLSFVLVATGLTALTTVSVDAHGYVKEPASRGYQGFLDKNQLGWSAAHDKYGAVIDDPQSLEGKKGSHKLDLLMGTSLQLMVYWVIIL